MIHLKTKEERELWKKAAVNAIATVEGAQPECGERVLTFVRVISDGVILEYRKRSVDETKRKQT